MAQTEAMVERMLSSSPPRKRPTFIVKDVRLFLNTITRSLDLYALGRSECQCKRQDSEDEILLTIHIPRKILLDLPFCPKRLCAFGAFCLRPAHVS